MRRAACHIDPDLPGKTLIFCATDVHANMVVRLLTEAMDEAYEGLSDKAIRKITGAASSWTSWSPSYSDLTRAQLKELKQALALDGFINTYLQSAWRETTNVLEGVPNRLRLARTLSNPESSPMRESVRPLLSWDVPFSRPLNNRKIGRLYRWLVPFMAQELWLVWNSEEPTSLTSGAAAFFLIVDKRYDDVLIRTS